MTHGGNVNFSGEQVFESSRQWFGGTHIHEGDHAFPFTAVPSYNPEVESILSAHSDVLDRDDDLTAILDALSNRSSMWVTGAPWSGKTSVTCELYRQLTAHTSYTAIAFFCIDRYTNRSRDYCKALSAQLAELLDRPRLVHSDTSVAIDQLAIMLDELVERESATGRHVVLILDGVDEQSQQEPFVPLLVNRRDISIVIATRDRATAEDKLPRHHVLLSSPERSILPNEYSRASRRTIEQHLLAALKDSSSRSLTGVLSAVPQPLALDELSLLSQISLSDAVAALEVLGLAVREFRRDRRPPAYAFAHAEVGRRARDLFDPSQAGAIWNLIFSMGMEAAGQQWPRQTPTVILALFPDSILKRYEYDRDSALSAALGFGTSYRRLALARLGTGAEHAAALRSLIGSELSKTDVDEIVVLRLVILWSLGELSALFLPPAAIAAILLADVEHLLPRTLTIRPDMVRDLAIILAGWANPADYMAVLETFETSTAQLQFLRSMALRTRRPEIAAEAFARLENDFPTEAHSDWYELAELIAIIANGDPKTAEELADRIDDPRVLTLVRVTYALANNAEQAALELLDSLDSSTDDEAREILRLLRLVPDADAAEAILQGVSDERLRIAALTVLVGCGRSDLMNELVELIEHQQGAGLRQEFYRQSAVEAKSEELMRRCITECCIVPGFNWRHQLLKHAGFSAAQFLPQGSLFKLASSIPSRSDASAFASGAIVQVATSETISEDLQRLLLAYDSAAFELRSRSDAGEDWDGAFLTLAELAEDRTIQLVQLWYASFAPLTLELLLDLSADPVDSISAAQACAVAAQNGDGLELLDRAFQLAKENPNWIVFRDLFRMSGAALAKTGVPDAARNVFFQLDEKAQMAFLHGMASAVADFGSPDQIVDFVVELGLEDLDDYFFFRAGRRHIDDDGFVGDMLDLISSPVLKASLEFLWRAEEATHELLELATPTTVERLYAGITAALRGHSVPDYVLRGQLRAAVAATRSHDWAGVVRLAADADDESRSEFTWLLESLVEVLSDDSRQALLSEIESTLRSEVLHQSLLQRVIEAGFIFAPRKALYISTHVQFGSRRLETLFKAVARPKLDDTGIDWSSSFRSAILETIFESTAS